ncbi:hypothetical protein L6164_028543 [Bauhinia variegata]|uniref:Uncharacterized protein n=1 Tax=Bauhinia variegata TaxID=167791 RepID=A0ACB9L697_BAUVA|nr:hypothetical protein L6164_028543 [Bauhinia variegata]
MIGPLIASLKDFVSQGQLSNAFKTFSSIQHCASSSGSFEHILHPISSLLLSCINLKSLPQGKQLHAQIILLGLGQHPVLVPRLVTLYTRLNLLADAHIVAENSNILQPLPWNLLISSYVRNGLFVEAISAYKKMLNKQVKPDDFTYPSVLKACGEASDLVLDAISWNTMISNYASRDMWGEAFWLFESMQKEGIEQSIIVWNTIAGGYLRTGNFRGALVCFLG